MHTATAPRITLNDIELNIASEQYFTAAQGVSGAANQIHDPNERGPLSLLTICVLVLKNGFTVTGESACASPENFDAEVGRKIAREAAVQKVWPLMGYALKEHLAAAPSRREAGGANDKIRNLLEALRKATFNESGPDRALYCLLRQFENDLPELDERFHKAFRQTDITGSGKIDMAIWHLIGASAVFWDCFSRVTAGVPPQIAPGGSA